MAVLLSACALGLVLPAHWPSTVQSSPSPSIRMLESFDGKFTRSQERDVSNSVFCGMNSIDESGAESNPAAMVVSPTGSRTTGTALESFDGMFMRSQARDAANSKFCGMNTLDQASTVHDALAAAPPNEDAATAGKALESFDGRFQRSQERDAANSVSCGMYNL